MKSLKAALVTVTILLGAFLSLAGLPKAFQKIASPKIAVHPPVASTNFAFHWMDDRTNVSRYDIQVSSDLQHWSVLLSTTNKSVIVPETNQVADPLFDTNQVQIGWVTNHRAFFRVEAYTNIP